MINIKILIVSLTLFLPQPLLADTTAFPEEVFSKKAELNHFITSWYDKQLKALDEVSIYPQQSESEKTIIRFIWLRTFENPVSIRLETDEDGTGFLYTKVTNGTGGYDPGSLITNTQQKIDKEDVTSLIKLVEDTSFYDISSEIKQNGLDGALWIIECLSKGNSHRVARWSPDSGPVRDIGIYLLQISGLEGEEIY